jgi:hypothetical protein
MNAADLASEIGHPGAEDLLRQASLVRLAYSGSDGSPRVVPVGFHWNGQDVVVCTATTAPKVKALSARPKVALTIDTANTPATAKALLIRGIATVEIVEGVPAEYLDGSAKALDDPQRQALRRRCARRTSAWRGSRSNPSGPASTTLEPAGSPRFSASS